ncbi:hypothetical protein PQY04_001652 [Salmonella enterica]|nr:hypothetical protein [Salmonella enterica subsp. houtenae serovar 50:z4,z23:-]EDQ1074221.1 hypothetical protein [Salmonella enterica]EDV3252724.1 hypothetical protein [Salmonella enterica subsp. houtenae]EDW0441125.1 hypothetical protein [Salmonella enterica subsp. arizonae serovar 50:z4,z23:-]HAE7875578.1 hypothetical protein [Salmonella enterica subsp. enterica serovar 1,9,12:-:-]HCZ1711964.1 hypothetical protein [Salmonella enterica subsp. enterica serovar Montevideo str. 0269]
MKNTLLKFESAEFDYRQSEPPKGRYKRWQHSEFGRFMLRRALPEYGQKKQG